jgi:tRNA A-37 threonylcarbamoyl transferase component Bud32
MDNNVIKTEQLQIKPETLTHVLSKMLSVNIVHATYQTRQLHGGTLGNVQLVAGMAVTNDGGELPYRVVLKIQKKWERYGDSDSWRREYDLYRSDLDSSFSDSLKWPKCYHAELNNDETQIWMEYIDGVSGLDLTGEMYERAAEELGRFQGKMYAEQPVVLQNLSNLSKVNFIKDGYLHYRGWNELYDYIRSDDCEIPKHLCKMIIDIDDNADEIWSHIESLPIVLCHRDFWVANIFYSNGKIGLIDWDTAGWGHMGEDIASLIADEADVDHMVEYYNKCVPAYYRGFSEYADVSHISNHYIRELILYMFGYRLIEWFKFADSPDEKTLQINTLQKIYEMSI